MSKMTFQLCSGRSSPHPRGSLDDVVWRSIWYYPGMFSDGGRVLHHLYCVIGNGYEWVDGRLAALCDEEDDDRDVFSNEDEVLKHIGEGASLADLRRQQLIDVRRRNAEVFFRRDQVDLLCLDRGRRWSNLYPLYEYSKLADVPNDAATDFVTGARMAIDLAFGWLFDFDLKKIRKPEHHRPRKSQQVLDAALEGIIRRFGNRSGPSNGHRQWTSYAEYKDFETRHRREISKLFEDMLGKAK